MYVPFAKELFGLDKTDFINGEQLSYFDGKCYSNKSDDRNISANTENDAKSRVNSFSGFGINDMACYETAPSMTFGRLHNNDIKSSAVPYKQIDSNGKHIYSTEKDMNIVSNNKKSQIKNKKNHETVTQNEESEDIVDEDGYIQLTTFGKHKILKYGDPLEYVNKSFKLPTKKSKKLLAVDWDLCLVLGVVKKVDESFSSFKFCNASVSNPTKEQIRYFPCKSLMSTDKNKNGMTYDFLYYIYSNIIFVLTLGIGGIRWLTDEPKENKKKQKIKKRTWAIELRGPAAFDVQNAVDKGTNRKFGKGCHNDSDNSVELDDESIRSFHDYDNASSSSSSSTSDDCGSSSDDNSCHSESEIEKRHSEDSSCDEDLELNDIKSEMLTSSSTSSNVKSFQDAATDNGTLFIYPVVSST
jgi:hypothetical protein